MHFKKSLQIKPRFILKFTLITFFILTSFQHTKAQTEIQDKGIAISPAIMQFEANPGEVIQGDVKLKNATSSDLTVSLTVRNFTSNNENGAPVFLENDVPFEASLADWIKLEKSEVVVEKIEIDKSNTAVVKFTITVPEDAEPGGYYAAVLANNKDAVSSANKNVQFLDTRGSLILLTVRGEVKKNLELVKFFTADPFLIEKKETNVLEWFPVDIVTRLGNTGNTHVIPIGNIFIYQGEAKIAEIKFNEAIGNILRESSRTYETVWGDTFFELKPITKEVDGQSQVQKDEKGNTLTNLGVNLDKLANLRFGQFKAKLSLAYDTGGGDKKSIVAEYEFWVVPWKLLLIIIVLIITLIFIKRKLSARKRRKRPYY